jgi:enoyl-[acyl-carrier protein] reductase II
MLKTAICNLFGIQYPIIQGGMAHLATAELVSAVSNAGGLGVIAAGTNDGHWLREQIHRTRSLTKNPFGINLYLPSRKVEEQIKVILEEKVSIIVTAAGSPAPYLDRLKKANIAIVPVISTVEQTEHLDQSKIDAVIAEGMEAGGHVGEITTISLIPQVVDAVRVPVIAAGGIADKRGMEAVLALGAEGIQMGTRFICSKECLAHPNFKSKIISAKDTDTLVIGRSTGHPVRCFSNQFSRSYLELEKAGATREELDNFTRGRLYSGVIEGNLEEGLLMAGQISGLIKEIKSVKAIIEDIVSGLN